MIVWLVAYANRLLKNGVGFAESVDTLSVDRIPECYATADRHRAMQFDSRESAEAFAKNYAGAFPVTFDTETGRVDYMPP